METGSLGSSVRENYQRKREVTPQEGCWIGGGASNTSREDKYGEQEYLRPPLFTLQFPLFSLLSPVSPFPGFWT